MKIVKVFRDLVMENEILGKLMRDDSASREILFIEVEMVKSFELCDLFLYGFVIYYVGMSCVDCILVEEFFGDGYV